MVRRHLVGLLTTLLLVAACGSASTQAEQATSLSEFFGSQVDDDDSVIECMKERGFEYRTPQPHVLGPTNLDQSTVEFAEEFGFGISTVLIDSPMFGAELPSDANEDYLSELSPLAKEAWMEALYGEDAPCSAGGQTDRLRRQVQSAFGAEFKEIEDLIAADPRGTQALVDWQSCVAELGYLYENPNEIGNEFMGRLSALASQSSDDNEAIAQLQELERTTAVDTFDCNTDLHSTREDLRSEYERNFIVANSGALEAIKRANE